MHLLSSVAIRPNLELKTRLKQLLVSLRLDITLPGACNSFSLFLNLSLSFSDWSERVRERERKREREKEKEREREREREGERERARERGRERKGRRKRECRIWFIRTKFISPF